MSPSETQICSAGQSFAMAGMLLGGALAIVGLVLTIVGTVQTGKKRHKDLPQQSASISASPPKEYQTVPSNNVNKIFCRYCGKERDTSGEFCSRCGRSVQSNSVNMKVCRNCNSSMSEDSQFCANFGRKFNVIDR